jgi:nucleotide-binding universal stress UspA family protein
MFRSILVPLDGSPAAEHALPWALSLAQQSGATLHLARVHLAPVPVMVGTEMAADVVLDNAIRENDKLYLEKLTEKLGTAATVNVRYALLDGGVNEAVLDYAKTIFADAIVMTSHGHGAFARFWLGSVADSLVRQSTVPTLLVRPRDDQAADLSGRPFVHRVVVPLDGSDLAETAVGPATQLAGTCAAALDLVMVVEDLSDEALHRIRIDSHETATAYPEAVVARAEEYLDKVAERPRASHLKVTAKAIRHGSPAAAVLEYAGAHGNAVIALATHGRGGVRRLLLGSVADKLIRGATLPVLVCRPAEG